MTIKEALERQPGSQGEEMTSFLGRPDSPDERNQEMWEKYTLNRGAEVLTKAGIPLMLEELADIIRPEFPDVRIDYVDLDNDKPNDEMERRFHLSGDGSVSIRLGWDYQRITHLKDRRGNNIPVTNLSGVKGSRGPHVFNEVSVTAFPFTGELTISYHNKQERDARIEVISRDVWNTEEGRKRVEDAIVLAYKYPHRVANTVASA